MEATLISPMDHTGMIMITSPNQWIKNSSLLVKRRIVITQLQLLEQSYQVFAKLLESISCINRFFPNIFHRMFHRHHHRQHRLLKNVNENRPFLPRYLLRLIVWRFWIINCIRINSIKTIEMCVIRKSIHLMNITINNFWAMKRIILWKIMTKATFRSDESILLNEVKLHRKVKSTTKIIKWTTINLSTSPTPLFLLYQRFRIFHQIKWIYFILQTTSLPVISNLKSLVGFSSIVIIECNNIKL